MPEDNQDNFEFKELGLTKLAITHGSLLLATTWAVAYIDKPSKWLIVPIMIFLLGLVLELLSIPIALAVKSDDTFKKADEAIDKETSEDNESFFLKPLLMNFYQTEHGRLTKNISFKDKEAFLFLSLFLTFASAGLLLVGVISLAASATFKLFGFWISLFGSIAFSFVAFHLVFKYLAWAYKKFGRGLIEE